jgi:hypothetical protein
MSAHTTHNKPVCASPLKRLVAPCAGYTPGHSGNAISLTADTTREFRICCSVGGIGEERGRYSTINKLSKWKIKRSADFVAKPSLKSA